jgi:hypothetical protein
MTEPREKHPHEDEQAPDNLHPGRHDQGGHGGMATRELDARQEDEEPADD